jgi:hypothetical protein
MALGGLASGGGAGCLTGPSRQLGLRGVAQVAQGGPDQGLAGLLQHPRRVTVVLAAWRQADSPLFKHLVNDDVQRHRRAQQLVVDVRVQRGPGQHEAGLSMPPSAPRRATLPNSAGKCRKH